MGWQHDDAPGHEGYPVALVPVWPAETRNRVASWSDCTRFRELTDADGRVTGVHTIQAACECGWRSERLQVSTPVEWEGIVFAPERVRDRAERLWIGHVALVSARLKRAEDAWWVDVGEQIVRTLQRVELCRCGHEFSEHNPSLQGWPRLAGSESPAPVPCDASGCLCRNFRHMPTPP